MFTNIGKKIQVLAKVICWIGISLSVLFGIIMITAPDTLNSSSKDGTMTGVGLVTIIIGSLGSWIGSFALYGFGELIVRVKNIDEKLSNASNAEKIRNDDIRRSPALSQSNQPERRMPLNSTISKEEAPRPIMIDPEERKTEVHESNNDESNFSSNRPQIDPEWIIEGSKWVKCPNCGEKRPRDFIRATKKCPVCGQAAIQES